MLQVSISEGEILFTAIKSASTRALGNEFRGLAYLGFRMGRSVQRILAVVTTPSAVNGALRTFYVGIPDLTHLQSLGSIPLPAVPLQWP